MKAINIRISMVMRHYEIEFSRNNSDRFKVYLKLSDAATRDDVMREVGYLATSFCCNNINGIVRIIDLISKPVDLLKVS